MGKTKTIIVEGQTEKTVSGEEKYAEKMKKKAVASASSETIVKEDKKKPHFAKASRGKQILGMRTKVDRAKIYPITEAVILCKDTSYSKFVGTLEIHLQTKKHPLTANVNLPYSTGKQKRIEIASEATLTKLAKGTVDFDVLLATAEMMPKLVPFAKLLGPKGLMPNPKTGTLIKSEKEADKFKGNSMTLKTEKEAPLIHTIAGKLSQDDKELVANVEAILTAIDPKQIIKAFLKPTMGPSVRVI
jgi:large subunit ribosomal protein L1